MNITDKGHNRMPINTMSAPQLFITISFNQLLCKRTVPKSENLLNSLPIDVIDICMLSFLMFPVVFGMSLE